MKSQRWVFVAVVVLCLGIILSGYLVIHHYNLMYGQQESKSFCSVSATLDCDAVNTSLYSEVFGIPVALFAALSFLIEILLLFAYRAFAEGEKQRLARYYFYLTFCNVLATIGMALISTFVLKTYCLMCITLYAVCLITFLVGWGLVEGNKFAFISDDFTALFRSTENAGARGVLILILLIPAGAWLGNAMYRDSMKGELEKVVADSIAEWQTNKKTDFSFLSPHEEGNPQAPMTIVEFSDFQCPHCRHAAPTLHAFVDAHRSNVHFIFQNYPLDQSCNSKMKSALHDQACKMAKVALCAQKQNKFTEAHDWIFEHQDGLDDSSLGDLCKDLKLDKAAVELCMQDKSTEEELAKEIDQGNLAGIEGTPSIYVNGRYLPAGFLIPVLEAAFKTIH